MTILMYLPSILFLALCYYIFVRHLNYFIDKSKMNKISSSEYFEKANIKEREEKRIEHDEVRNRIKIPFVFFRLILLFYLYIVIAWCINALITPELSFYKIAFGTPLLIVLIIFIIYSVMDFFNSLRTHYSNGSVFIKR